MHQIANLPAECGECEKPWARIEPDYTPTEVATIRSLRMEAHTRAVADALLAAAKEAFGENPVAVILAGGFSMTGQITRPKSKSEMFDMFKDALRHQMEKQDGHG